MLIMQPDSGEIQYLSPELTNALEDLDYFFCIILRIEENRLHCHCTMGYNEILGASLNNNALIKNTNKTNKNTGHSKLVTF